MLVLVASGLILVFLAIYWVRMDIRGSGRYRSRHLILLPALLLTLVLLERRDGGLHTDASPVFVAIVADVSLSMGTLPEPLGRDGVGTRLQRARRALLPVLAELEASTRPVMVGVTAFTSKAETILAWDDNFPQVREAVEFVLTPGLLTESGSDLGAALEGAVRLFELLPATYRDSDSGKFLILVSDGEQNVDRSGTATALQNLREQGVRIISLHVGLSDVPEGLPVYDAGGAFVGFDQVGRQIFSVPDPAVMHEIAGPVPEQGIFVKAEESDAAGTTMEFIGIRTAGSRSGSGRLVLLVVLWCLTTAVVVRHV